MLFLIDKAFSIFARPVELALVLLSASFILLVLGRWRLGLALLGIVAFSGIATVLLPVDDWLLAPLEARFPRPVQLPACIDGILMIGAGEDRRGTTAWHEPLLMADFGSFLEAQRLMRTHPEAGLLFSGYGSNARGMITEAAIGKQILVQMGVAPARIRLEERSRDTWQNFRYAQQIAAPTTGQVWVLVATAAHIPRSIGIARHLGWTMIADPTSYQSAPDGGLIPQADLLRKLQNIQTALHEWEGLMGYWLEGHTDTLFPAPTPLSEPQKSKSPQCMRAA